ncbi:uncharacterized protein DFL_000106 [Arthrobotrys flagrans]|uniref:Uncharacterized protein n=1 Tax=Arthrobotrys flagrans TaxID=97331 RepID=A0A437ACV5_ARTFL|nr:hypothetical protein DFL_000106 [Arthrobotrys flagrans]
MYDSDDSEEYYRLKEGEEREKEEEEAAKEEAEEKARPIPAYGYVHFEDTVNVMDVGSETSSIAEVEGEEADDEIGYTASQYLPLSIDNGDTINPEDSDEYEDMEMNENDTQETLDSFQDPQFDVSPDNCRYDEEDNTQYESQYSQFDTQEYLANAANIAQEPYPKPKRSVNLTMDPREVEKIRNKNLYRR